MPNIFERFSKGGAHSDPMWKYISQELQTEATIHHEQYALQELQIIYRAIMDIAGGSMGEGSKIKLANTGSVIVIPLLIAHAGSTAHNSRDCVLWALHGIPPYIISELARYMDQAKYMPSGNIWPRYGDSERYSKDCYEDARFTAYIAIVERAIEGKEDRDETLGFMRRLANDSNSRIKDTLKGYSSQILSKM